MSELIQKLLYGRILKVDETKQEIHGIFAEQKPDNDGEVFDYAASKPYWVDWSTKAFERSGGKSYGNLRVMHQLKVAGRVTDISFNDDDCTITGVVKVTDADEWQHCVDGDYTGFSYGGNNAAKPVKKADGFRWLTISPVELSLVDSPCQEGAVFELLKADGASVMKPFAAKAAEKVPETKETTPGKTTPGGAMATKPEVVKAKITEANKLLKAISSGEIRKGIYAIGGIADLLQSLYYYTTDSEWEREYEGDDSKVPEMLREVLTKLAEALKAMTEEEVSELIGTAPKGDGTMKINTGMIAKALRETKEPESIKAADHLEKIGKLAKNIKKAHTDMGKHVDELCGTNEESDGNTEAETDENKEQSSEKAIVAAITKANAGVVKALNEKIEASDARISDQEKLIVGLTDLVIKALGSQPEEMKGVVNTHAVSKVAETAPAGSYQERVQKATEAKDAKGVMALLREAGPSGYTIGHMTVPAQQ